MNDKSSVFLAIDDMIENLISVKALIKESFPDAVVLTAQSGKEGLKIAREQKPDIILLDIMMPEMNGYDVCRVLKADPVLQDIPVIFVTALNSDKQTRLKALQSGGEAFINKPIDELELYIQLRTLLRLREYNVNKKKRISNLEENLVFKGKELEASEERFRLMVESISDTIGIADVNGNVKFRSANNEKLFGIKSEDIVGQNSFDFVHPDDRERLHNEFIGLIEDGVGAKRIGEFKYLRKDGSTVTVELEGKNMLDNKLIDGLFLTFHDITEQKAVDRKMKEESEKLKALIESTDDMVWVVDPVEFGLITFNHALSQYFKTGRELEIEVGMRPEDLLPKGYSAEWIRMYNKVLAQGAYKVEYETSTNNRILDLSFYPVEIENEIIGISVMGQDITERKQTEKEILAANENLNNIMNSSMFGAVTIGKDKKIRWANPAAVAMMGASSIEDILGKKCTEYFCPAHKDMCPIMDLGQIVDNSEKKIKRNDGREIPIIKSVSEITIDDESLLLETFIDITNQKQSEMALKIETERYHALIESTNDWVWVAEPEHYGLMMFNSSIADYFKEKHNIILEIGLTPEEMLSEKRFDEWIGYYEKTIKDGTLFIDYFTDAGKLRFQITLTRLDVEGQLIGISVIGRDVTKEMQYKQKLEESNLSLTVILQQAINTISKIGELRDVYTAGHQKKVAELSGAIAKEMGLSEETIANILLGALIHDIGKIYIASDILNKPGKITDLEYQIMQTHAEKSYEVIKEIDFPSQIKTMIYQHHERMDGSGYPNKLVADQIILESRILAVADVVEAMVSHRPYRAALGIDVALEEITKNRGTKYDADVVDICTKLFRENNFTFTT